MSHTICSIRHLAVIVWERTQSIFYRLFKSNKACQYRMLGCKKTGSSKEIYKHAKLCEYQRTKCTFPSCNWVGSYNLLFMHWSKAHKQFIKENGCVITAEWETYLIRAHKTNFILQCQVDTDFNYYFWVHHQSPRKVSQFKFYFKYVNHKTGRREIVKGSCYPSTGAEICDKTYLSRNTIGFQIKRRWYREYKYNRKDRTVYLKITPKVKPDTSSMKKNL